MRLIILTLMAALAAAQAVAAPQTQDKAAVALKAAMDKEVLDGNLKAAIEAYKKLAQGKDRAVAAKALVRMGQCYDKLGDTESRKAFERVVREFGDQKEAVEAARTRLAALGGGTAGKSVMARLVTADIGDRYIWGVSRDGRYLLENDSRDIAGSQILSVRDVTTGEDRIVARANSPVEDICCNIISPDGKQLAYGNLVMNEKSRGELYVASINGSNRRILVSGEMGVSFVPGD